MKTFKLYISFLKTFLKSGVKLNLSILIISVAAVLSFVALISTFRSSLVDRKCIGKPYYQVVFNDKINDDTVRMLKDKMPEIIWGESVNSYFFYYSREKDVLCEGVYYPAFPKIWEEAFLYLNEPYTVYEGRDITEEERNEEKGVIIASKNSMLSVGDKIILPLTEGEAQLTVVGISDNFIIPISYAVRYYGLFKEGERYEETVFFKMPNCNLTFERVLSTDELGMLSDISEFYYMCTDLTGDSLTDTIEYIVSVVGMAIIAVYAALQIYTLFLYLASKVSYQTAVCEICGCSDVKITAVIMLAVFTYIVFSVAVGAALMPIFVRLTELCHMNYIPTFFDFLLSLAIYMIVVSVAVLPGIRKISNASPAGEVK